MSDKHKAEYDKARAKGDQVRRKLFSAERKVKLARNDSGRAAAEREVQALKNEQRKTHSLMEAILNRARKDG